MRLLVLAAAATLLLLAATACAPRLRTGPEERILSDEPENLQANRQALETLVARAPDSADQRVVERERTLPVLPVTVVEPPEADAERGEGRIARDELRTFIDQGPHVLFRAVELEPVLNGEAFRGFRVAALATEPPALRESGLRVGDVVTTVNGTDISNPDGFMRVWDNLRDADALTVEIVRAGDARTLAWNIR